MTHYVRSRFYDPVSPLLDLKRCLSNLRLPFSLAIEDLKGRYYKTLIGPVWIAASFAVFIAVKIYVFSSLNDAPWKYFASYLTLGYMIWVFIQTSIIEGSSAFVQARGWILGTNCSYSVFVCQSFFRSLIITSTTAFVAIGISAFLVPVTLQSLGMALLGFAAIMPITILGQFFLATISVFIRDVIHLVQAAMRVLFFLTPIVWLPSMLGAKADVLKFNPFTHMLNVIRKPLLGEPIEFESWFAILLLTGLLLLVNIVVIPLLFRKIPSNI